MKDVELKAIVAAIILSASRDATSSTHISDALKAAMELIKEAAKVT